MDFVAADDLFGFVLKFEIDLVKAARPGLAVGFFLAELALVEAEGHLFGVVALEFEDAFSLALDDAAKFFGFAQAAFVEKFDGFGGDGVGAVLKIGQQFFDVLRSVGLELGFDVRADSTVARLFERFFQALDGGFFDVFFVGFERFIAANGIDPAGGDHDELIMQAGGSVTI